MSPAFYTSRRGWVGFPQTFLWGIKNFPPFVLSPTLFDSMFHFLPRTGESMPATPGLQRTILSLCPKASKKRCATIGKHFVVICFLRGFSCLLVWADVRISQQFWVKVGFVFCYRVLACDVTRHNAAVLYSTWHTYVHTFRLLTYCPFTHPCYMRHSMQVKLCQRFFGGK